MSKDTEKNEAPARIDAPESPAAPVERIRPWRDGGAAKAKRIGLPLKRIAEWAEAAVLEAAQNADLNGGEARAEAAIDALAKKVDDAISPPNPLAEIASDIAIAGARFLLGAIIEDAFARLRAQGRA